MAAHKNLNPNQFDRAQMRLFNPDNPEETNTLSADDMMRSVMDWMRHPTNGFRSGNKWRPGWNRDNS